MSSAVAVIRSVNPESVLTPESILYCGLRTLGVPAHHLPQFAFQSTIEDGRRELAWVLQDKTPEGEATQDLINRWHDPYWLAANPESQLAIVKRTLENMLRLAEVIRDTVPLIVHRRGSRSVHIPADATETEQAAWLAKLD